MRGLTFSAINKSYYTKIRDEVKAWVSANYESWIEEKPDWFTDRVEASIPKDMIPESDVEQTTVSGSS